jgi:hypothetical protein
LSNGSSATDFQSKLNRAPISKIHQQLFGFKTVDSTLYQTNDRTGYYCFRKRFSIKLIKKNSFKSFKKFLANMERPNYTIYINNLNEKVKKEGSQSVKIFKPNYSNILLKFGLVTFSAFVLKKDVVNISCLSRIE